MKRSLIWAITVITAISVGIALGARFDFRITAPQWIAEISVITDYAGSQELILSLPTHPPTLHRKSGS